ncbi:MAG: hypothetical protein KAI15_07935, partial [Gammaproteobacteria bacterium]|nr:hypothetical protein [Gammaproteobacteria bacterium]
MRDSLNIFIRTISVMTLFAFALPAMAETLDELRNRSPDDLKNQSDKVWDENLRPGAFQDREINENQVDAV